RPRRSPLWEQAGGPPAVDPKTDCAARRDAGADASDQRQSDAVQIGAAQDDAEVPPFASSCCRSEFPGGEMTKPIVQISLDVTEIGEALETAEMALRAGVDWLEAGTPLIIAEGMHGVRA